MKHIKKFIVISISLLTFLFACGSFYAVNYIRNETYSLTISVGEVAKGVALGALYVVNSIRVDIFTSAPSVAKNISKAIFEKQTKQVVLKDMTNFSWDQAVIFGPYTDSKLADQTLGFAWPDFRYYGMQDSDTQNLIVFIKQGVVLRASLLIRSDGDFSYDVTSKMLTPESVVFNVLRNDGWAIMKIKKN